MKVAPYSFSGSIPVKFFLSIDYDTINKLLKNLATTVAIDKDENLL